jgi:hypothetical protein
MTKHQTGLWLKSVGTGATPVDADWLRRHPDIVKRVGFPDRGFPTVEQYDYLAIYLAGRQKIVGVLEVLDNPVWDPTRIKSKPAGRWPWICRVRPILLVPHADDAPSLRDVGIDTLSVRNQSHISLDEATWMRVVGALAAAAAIQSERYVAAYA